MLPFLNSLFGSTAVNVVAQHFSKSWPWYLIRGAGIVAVVLLILLTLSGIGQVTGIIYRWIEPIKVRLIHRAIAIALAASIVIHVGFLLVDHYVSFSLKQIFIPFTSQYNNGTKLLGIPLSNFATAFGILAMYGIAMIIISSLIWIDTRKSIWRTLHYLAYIVVLLIIMHVLYVGTDFKHGLLRLLFMVAAVIVAIALAVRLYRVGTIIRDDN